MKFPHRPTCIQSARWLVAVLLVIIITGCAAVGPDYKRLEAPVYEDWGKRGRPLYFIFTHDIEHDRRASCQDKPE